MSLPSLASNGELKGRLYTDLLGQYDPLIPPALLRHDIPVPPSASKTISQGRRAAASIVNGSDPNHRLLIIVGPCSIHDVDQAKEYASRLREGVKEGKWPGLEVIMRVYLSVLSPFQTTIPFIKCIGGS